ncbi:MAG: hypothetical protein V3S21_02285, partial [Xanthomonadales bacterium]
LFGIVAGQDDGCIDMLLCQLAQHISYLGCARFWIQQNDIGVGLFAGERKIIVRVDGTARQPKALRNITDETGNSYIVYNYK